MLLGLAYLLVWFRQRTHWDLTPPPRSDNEAPAQGYPLVDGLSEHSVKETKSDEIVSYTGSPDGVAPSENSSPAKDRDSVAT